MTTPPGGPPGKPTVIGGPNVAGDVVDPKFVIGTVGGGVLGVVGGCVVCGCEVVVMLGVRSWRLRLLMNSIFRSRFVGLQWAPVPV